MEDIELMPAHAKLNIVHSQAKLNIAFRGRILPNQTFIISFPCIYEKEWAKLTKTAFLSTCCVFYPDGDPMFGDHTPDPLSQCSECYCRLLYGSKREWGCWWFEKWVSLFKQGIELGLQPIVLTKNANRRGEDPWPLGHSQIGEVQYAQEYLNTNANLQARFRIFQYSVEEYTILKPNTVRCPPCPEPLLRLSARLEVTTCNVNRLGFLGPLRQHVSHPHSVCSLHPQNPS